MGFTLNITAGNDKRVVLQLLNGLHDEGREPFPVELSEDVAVKMVSEVGTRHAVSFTVGDEGRVLLDLKGSDYKIGLWGIEVVGRLNGAKWRAYGDSLIHYTPATERGAEQVTVAADAGELTLVVGYATDIVPRRTSELVNDGEDGEHPFATEEQLKKYAPLKSPEFEGIPRGNDIEEIQSGYATTSTRSPLTTFGAVKRIIAKLKGMVNGLASLGSDGKVPVAQIPVLPYIPSNKKGAANGVAELDANRKVFNDQLYFAPRGTTTAAAMDGELEAGLYLVNGFKVADEVLGGDGANGFLLQATGASRGQLLVVGRAADAVAGEQVETYTRRWLPTPQRWTQWHRLDEPAPEYSLDKSGTAIRLLRDGSVVATVTDSNTTYKAMTAAQATAGTATTGLLISPKVLADYIKDRIRSSISQYYLIGLSEIGQNQYEVDDSYMVEDIIVGLNDGDILKCQVEVNLSGNGILPLARFNYNMLWFSYASAEESVIYEVQISRDSGGFYVDYFIRVIPSE